MSSGIHNDQKKDVSSLAIQGQSYGLSDAHERRSELDAKCDVAPNESISV
jgi:hypothetical protein